MRRVRFGVVIAAGLALAVALAFFVSPQASSEPDGLNRVAIDQGFADQGQEHQLEDSPLAGYGVEGIGDDRLSTGVSGVIGVAVTFAVGAGLLLAARRVRRRRAPEEPTMGFHRAGPTLIDRGARMVDQ